MSQNRTPLFEKLLIWEIVRNESEIWELILFYFLILERPQQLKKEFVSLIISGLQL